MAWTAPRTWSVGEIVSASVMNIHVRDNLGALSTHGHTGVAGDGSDTIGTGVTLKIAAALGLTGVLTPTQLSANTDNWAPTNGAINTIWRASTDASRNLTGISISQASGRVLILRNVGSFNLVLKHDTTSTAVNRFSLPGAVDLTLGAGQTAWLSYDGTLTRWVVTALAASATDASLLVSDITTNNVSITAHGFVPKAPNDTTQWLRGDATWAKMALTTSSANLGADVTMTSVDTWYDGPSVPLATGVWLVIATFQFGSIGGADLMEMRLWDSVSVNYAAIQTGVSNGSSSNGHRTLAALITLAGTTTVAAAAQNATSAGGKMLKVEPRSTITPGTSILAVKVG